MTETKNGSLFSNLPQHWEDRQFRELDNLMELVRMMLTREFPTGLDSKRVFEGIGTLLAGPVGRRKEEKYRAGLAILRSGKHSKKSVFHEICKDLDPGYKILTLDETTLTAEEKKKRKDDRDRRRKAMKAGIRREAKRQGVNWPILPQGYETPANS